MTKSLAMPSTSVLLPMPNAVTVLTTVLLCRGPSTEMTSDRNTAVLYQVLVHTELVVWTVRTTIPVIDVFYSRFETAKLHSFRTDLLRNPAYQVRTILYTSMNMIRPVSKINRLSSRAMRRAAILLKFLIFRLVKNNMKDEIRRYLQALVFCFNLFSSARYT